MKLIPIRDLRSLKQIKPRVFDALLGQEQVLLDVKDSKKGNVSVSIRLFPEKTGLFSIGINSSGSSFQCTRSVLMA